MTLASNDGSCCCCAYGSKTNDSDLSFDGARVDQRN